MHRIRGRQKYRYSSRYARHRGYMTANTPNPANPTVRPGGRARSRATTTLAGPTDHCTFTHSARADSSAPRPAEEGRVAPLAACSCSRPSLRPRGIEICGAALRLRSGRAGLGREDASLAPPDAAQPARAPACKLSDTGSPAARPRSGVRAALFCPRRCTPELSTRVPLGGPRQLGRRVGRLEKYQEAPLLAHRRGSVRGTIDWVD